MLFSLETFFVAVSLAMDSFSVSVATGMRLHKPNYKQAAKVAFFFGFFQAFMPLLGWTVGELLQGFLASYDHWIAFVLLSAIGFKMIKESRGADIVEGAILKNKRLVILSLATSIDALIVGITLNLLKTPPLVSIAAIGLITFALCFAGYIFGGKIGKVFGKRIEILGGVALILIGLKILLEHTIF